MSLKTKALALVAVAGAVTTGVAVATPPASLVGSVMARGSLPVELKLATTAREGSSLEWNGRQWAPEKLPEFLRMLRTNGVTDFGAWLDAHPGAAARLGLTAIRTYGSPDVAVQTITIQPGGHSGWHSHPGPLFVVVKSGTVTRYDGTSSTCATTQVTAGQTFLENPNHVGAIRNEGSTPVELWITYLAPQPTGTNPLRIDQPKPAACPF